MNKEQLRKNVDKAKNEYKDGLTLIYNELNKGQRKKTIEEFRSKGSVRTVRRDRG